MPFVKRQGGSSQIDPKLKTRRKQIIEEERIRVLRESLILFYDKLMEKYELIHPRDKESETENIQTVSREEVEAFAEEYADTKPIGF